MKPGFWELDLFLEAYKTILAREKALSACICFYLYWRPTEKVLDHVKLVVTIPGLFLGGYLLAHV